MKKIIAVAAILFVTGCGADASGSYNDAPPTETYTGIDVGNQDGEVFYMHVPNDDGSDIPCIVYNAYGGGGAISCNWIPAP